MEKDHFYLTTTLPYVNALPHIGHTSEFVKADVIARFKRSQLGIENVFFNVGTDEHGLKNFQKARDLGKDPQEYVDELANGWKEFCQLFQISYDSFYRTSDPTHKERAQYFWNRSLERGDIYKKKYEGWYCVGCEEFKTEKDIVGADQYGRNGKCTIHQKELNWVEEENYFFKLSKYRDQLLDWIEKKPKVLNPKTRLPELRNWIANMQDISVSRSRENLKWGIDVPDDDTQVMYVWFDALSNYINVLGYGSEDELKVKTWWPGVQIFGVDNLRFQGGVWQGMLASINQPQTSKLLCNGFILASDGTKMSKSLGNTVDPFDQAQKYGFEAIRFYLVAGIPTYSDSPYREDDLVNLYNSHLANNFGNLLNRVLHLADKLEVKINDVEEVEVNFRDKVEEIVSSFNLHMNEYELSLAYEQAHQLASYGNEYITLEQPWSKDIAKDRAAIVLNNLSYLLSKLVVMYSYVLPKSSSVAESMLLERKKGVLFDKLELQK